MPYSQPAVFISPGKNPNPSAPKILLLGQVARDLGYLVEIIDYSGIESPEDRVQKLVASDASNYEHCVLVGVSMGGYVATVAAEELSPRGLFLLSPTLYLKPYAKLDPQPKAEFIAVVHGWHDVIVPVQNVFRFAQKFNAQIHLLDGDHSLIPHLPYIAELFGLFLEQAKRPSSTSRPIPTSRHARFVGGNAESGRNDYFQKRQGRDRAQ
jgi:hypothetical protein